MANDIIKTGKKAGGVFIRMIVILFVVLYVLSPIDLMPGPIDDIIIAILGLSFAGIDIGKVFGTAKSARYQYQQSRKRG